MIDLLIYSVGYEKRSAEVVQNVAARSRIALVFERYREFAFARNLEAAEARRDRLLNTAGAAFTFGDALDTELERLDRDSLASIRVGIDVSSMTRTLMAVIIRRLFSGANNRRFALSVFYAPAEYHEAPQETHAFIDFGPVPDFEGWTKYPERPLSVVVGLGYEVDQAIGAIEYLDPSGIWTFIPNGSDARFRRDVDRANRSFWPIVHSSHTLEYRVADPHLLYAELRGLAEALSQRSRVILVPGGPKIFSALCMLIKLELGDEVSIWRASRHGYVAGADVQPNGEVIRFDYPSSRRLLADTGTAHEAL